MKRRYLRKPPIGESFACSRCGESKPFTTEFFVLEKRAPCGLASHCRECKGKTDRDWRDRNPHKNIEYKRIYNKRHRERVNKNNAASRRRHPTTHSNVQARRRARKRDLAVVDIVNYEVSHLSCNIRKGAKVILGEDIISWQRRFTREPVDPETLDPEKTDYTGRELEDYADAILRKDAKEGNSIHGENPILFEEHLYNRRRREILVTSGTPDDIQGLDDERGVHRGDGQKIFNRTHPQGRKVNSEHQRRKNGASYYR